MMVIVVFAKKKNKFNKKTFIPIYQYFFRRKMFEKNQSIPTPIARFGESVTPAMIAKSKPVAAQPVSEPAWKRKREPSPVKNTVVPSAKKSSPDSYIRSAAKPRTREAAPPQISLVPGAAPVDTPVTPRIGNRVS